ncbi:unnamed protein product [Ambrosiozyma monospora]|uniref:Unnamed protein product n=1 Tax=Ambrosiozyma monospora TaxID=43982 RepID=A0A9W6YYH1_AMBMO|nr:unnamed protein product [Ambrosiozyma monospora]
MDYLKAFTNSISPQFQQKEPIKDDSLDMMKLDYRKTRDQLHRTLTEQQQQQKQQQQAKQAKKENVKPKPSSRVISDELTKQVQEKEQKLLSQNRIVRRESLSPSPIPNSTRQQRKSPASAFMKSKLSAQATPKSANSSSTSAYTTAPSSSSHSRSRSKLEQLSSKSPSDVNINNDRSFLKLEEVAQRDKLRTHIQELKKQREEERREFRKQELEFERQIDELQDKNNALEKDVSSLNSQLSSLKLDKKRESRLLEENQNLIHQVDQLYTALKNKNIETTELKNELDGVKLEYEKLRTKQNWDSGKLRSKEDECDKLKQRLILKDNRIQDFKNTADSEFHGMELEIQRLLKMVDSLQGENMQLNKSMDALQKDNRSMKQLNIDMKRKLMAASTETEFKRTPTIKTNTNATVTRTVPLKKADMRMAAVQGNGNGDGDTTKLLKISGELLNAETYRSSKLCDSNNINNNNYSGKYTTLTDPLSKSKSKSRRYSGNIAESCSSSSSSSKHRSSSYAVSYNSKPKPQDDDSFLHHQNNQLQSSVLSDSSTFNAGDENDHDFNNSHSKGAGDTDYLCSRDIDLDFDLMPSWKVKHNHNNSNSNSKLSDRAPYTPYTDKIQGLDFGVGRGRGRMSVVGESSDTADLLNFDVL